MIQNERASRHEHVLDVARQMIQLILLLEFNTGMTME